jgi:hypothetical protein
MTSHVTSVPVRDNINSREPRERPLSGGACRLPRPGWGWEAAPGEVGALVFCVGAMATALIVVSQFRTSIDVTEDRRNSFSVANGNQLARLAEPLTITVHLTAEEPRCIDLQRNVLAKLERTMPHVSIRLATARQSFASSAGDEADGEIEYRFHCNAERMRTGS